MMGFPCLRFAGAFFASCDHRTGDLIVKLSRDRVAQLIAEGIGKPFAPGRPQLPRVSVGPHIFSNPPAGSAPISAPC